MTPHYKDDHLAIYNADAAEALRHIGKNIADLVVTSPPYDTLRDYDGGTYDFPKTASALSDALKPGGVIAWNEWEKIRDKSYSLSSVRHLLHFTDTLNLKNFERIFWNKLGSSFTNQIRYFSVVEWIWILSKGDPKTINLLKDRPTNGPRKTNRTHRRKDGSMRKRTTWRESDGTMRERWWSGTIGTHGKRTTLWDINPANKEPGYEPKDHPARFPIKLAEDLILSFSNEGDTILDPFIGSGTTAIAAKRHNRKCVGIEISKQYCDVAVKRYRREFPQ